VEWECAKAFCKSGEELEGGEGLRRAAYQRAEANRRHALNIQKLRAYEQARQQLPANNYLGGTPNHQQVASISVGPRVSNGLHREHVFTILRAMKRILDWDEEEDSRR
jgi:preprotein translocase subunit SecF